MPINQWTLIMQMTKSDVASAWDSVSSSIWLSSFGIQRDRQLWKVQFLVQNCCNEASHGSFMRIAIQTQDDGSTHRGTYPYVWR